MLEITRTTLVVWAGLSALAPPARAAAASAYPPPREATWIARDVRFTSGESLAEVPLHYRTLGTPVKDAQGVVRNAVLVLHGTGGSGAQFLQPQFADELFGPGQLLDVTKHYVILPDGIGHGQSAKPSDGLRMKFPRYGYADMVSLQHRLLTEGLGVNHLSLLLGTSMGGMQAWMWGYAFPDFTDRLVPLASAPTAIAGRNRVWRKMLMDAIRDDPAWNDGNYESEPRVGLRSALRLLVLMGSVPLQWQKLAPTRDAADAFLEEQIDRRLKTTDANDLLYQVDASRDYDPSPHLAEIQAPLLAINSADDPINPPELGLMERLMPRVKQGTYVLLPLSDRTRGHSTHTWAAVWREPLAAFLAGSPVSVAAQVEAKERELIRAIGSRDLAAYEGLVADDYVALRGAARQTKKQVIDGYKAGSLAYRDLGIEDVDVKVFGEVAVLSARTTGQRIENGQESPNLVRYLRVWARRDGSWQAVAQMAVPLPPE